MSRKEEDNGARQKTVNGSRSRSREERERSSRSRQEERSHRTDAVSGSENGRTQLQQLKTINRFEEHFETSSSNPLSLASHAGDPHKDKLSLVIISLVEQLAAAYEQEDERRVILAKSICQSLIQMKLINPTFAVTELSGLRAQYGLAFLRLITVARATLPPSPSGSLLPALLGPDHHLQNSMARLPTFFKSRYNQEFIEGRLLGRGGFGSVYLATNKLDHVMYAVKKIHVLLSRQNLLLKILREVTLLARLSHPNIVSYKTAWTEPYYGQISPSTEDTASSMSLEELNLDSGEVSAGTGDDSVRTGQTWTKVARIEEVVGSTPPDWSSGIQRVVGRAGSPAPRPRGPVGKFWLSQDGDTEGTSEEWEADDFSASVQFRDTESASDNNIEENQGAMIVFNRTNSIDGEAPTQAALLFIQMELCDSTLRQWLDDRNPGGCVDVRDNFKIFKQILMAVDYLHTKGILHRDIKPRNIFINSHLEVKLGDFGLAKEDFLPENIDPSCSGPVPNTPEELRTATFMPTFPPVNTSGVGTTAYAAPEQLRSGRVDNKSDMYSLGVVLFELYSTPLTEMERVRSISSLREGEPGCLEGVKSKYPVIADLISQLTSISPDTRPGAGELLAQRFSSKDLSLLEREREQRALREQVKLQNEQILKQEQLIAEQNAELELLRGVLARLSPTKTKPPSDS